MELLLRVKNNYGDLIVCPRVCIAGTEGAEPSRVVSELRSVMALFGKRVLGGALEKTVKAVEARNDAPNPAEPK